MFTWYYNKSKLFSSPLILNQTLFQIPQDFALINRRGMLLINTVQPQIRASGQRPWQNHPDERSPWRRWPLRGRWADKRGGHNGRSRSWRNTQWRHFSETAGHRRTKSHEPVISIPNNKKTTKNFIVTVCNRCLLLTTYTIDSKRNINKLDNYIICSISYSSANTIQWTRRVCSEWQ